MADLINPSPVVHAVRDREPLHAPSPALALDGVGSLAAFGGGCEEGGGVGGNEGGGGREALDASELFAYIRDIRDPEHPYSLEQLRVITEGAIHVDDEKGVVTLHFTPTVAHCSMATLIGLCLRVRLERVLPRRFKVDIAVAPGSHSTELAVCKQLADKERVAAALENENLRSMVEKCLAGDDDPLAG